MRASYLYTSIFFFSALTAFFVHLLATQAPEINWVWVALGFIGGALPSILAARKQTPFFYPVLFFITLAFVLFFNPRTHLEGLYFVSHLFLGLFLSINLAYTFLVKSSQIAFKFCASLTGWLVSYYLIAFQTQFYLPTLAVIILGLPFLKQNLAKKIVFGGAIFFSFFFTEKNIFSFQLFKTERSYPLGFIQKASINFGSYQFLAEYLTKKNEANFFITGQLDQERTQLYFEGYSLKSSPSHQQFFAAADFSSGHASKDKCFIAAQDLGESYRALKPFCQHIYIFEISKNYRTFFEQLNPDKNYQWTRAAELKFDFQFLDARLLEQLNIPDLASLSKTALYYINGDSVSPLIKNHTAFQSIYQDRLIVSADLPVISSSHFNKVP